MKLLVPPPVVALTCGLMMWGVSNFIPSMRLHLPLQTTLAYVLIIAGVSMDIASILAFRRAKTTVTPLAPEKASQLVVTGLYRFTRNPMYLGLALILTGVAVLLGSLFNTAIVFAFGAYITAFQIKPEEQRLGQIFGAEYVEYKERVRRWI